MTAEIGILNKQGVALAADSAVTIGNGVGHYDTANKVFGLSKYQPVAIMIYNNSSFMDCPMEIIIKEYRKRIKDDEYDTLEEYWTSFQKYLKEFCKENNLCNKKSLINYLSDYLESIDTDISEETDDIDEESFGDSGFDKQCLEERINSIINKIIDDEYKKLLKEKDDDNYKEKEKEIRLDIEEEIKEQIELIIGDVSNEISDKLIDCCVMMLTKKVEFDQYTGIVVCGYGKKDIYPKLLSNEFIGCYYDEIKKYKEISIIINDDRRASVIPFAQVDVIHTFMDGIDYRYLDIIENIIDNSDLFRKIKENDLVDNIDEKIENLNDSIIKEIEKYSKMFHWGPMMSTVASAPKEELVQMAETLVNLTSFRRKMIMDEYNETVGGPIDVVLITKGDGLIWIKRKKYFDKELNYQFFNNYNRMK